MDTNRTAPRRSPTLRSFLLCGLLATVGATAGAAASASTAPKDGLNAGQVLSRMAETYRGASSYQDEGEVTTVFYEARGERTVVKPFATAFVRPDRFRFEFRTVRGEQEEDRMIVWEQGGAVRVWWTAEPEEKKAASLDLALAGATGISGTSAHAVPSLLLPDRVNGRRLTELDEPARLEDATEGGVDCFRIQGRFGGRAGAPGAPMTLWTDKASFLLRKIETEKQFPKFRATETLTYRPTLNGSIAPRQLEFGAPAAAGR